MASYTLIADADSGVARVGVVRGPVPGVGRFYGSQSGRFARSARNLLLL